MLPYSTQHAAPVKNVLEAVKNEIPLSRSAFSARIFPPTWKRWC